MKIIKPSYKILTPIVGDELRKIELVARTCYKSEDGVTDGSAEKLVKMLIDRGHEDILKYSILSVRFICDRGVSHELISPRLASSDQESTRHCDYCSKGKFGNELTFIEPFFFKPDGGDSEEIRKEKELKKSIWLAVMHSAEDGYLLLIDRGCSPQEARAVLPNNSLKTEVVLTGNYLEWRLFFRRRAAKSTHPQMRELVLPLLKELSEKLPIIFDDVLLEVGAEDSQ